MLNAQSSTLNAQRSKLNTTLRLSTQYSALSTLSAQRSALNVSTFIPPPPRLGYYLYNLVHILQYNQDVLSLTGTLCERDVEFV